MFGDWKEKLGADRLTEKLIAKLNPGEVMLLHDCGTTLGADPKAPEHMLIALERMLEEARKRGLRSIRVDEMIKAVQNSPIQRLSFGKRLIVGLWLGWEQVSLRQIRSCITACASIKGKPFIWTAARP
jgi:hypothetical protein